MEIHGTTGGAKRHRQRKEPLCQPCRDAESAYNRSRRPQLTAFQRARDAALAELARRHPAEYRDLYNQHKGRN